MRIAALVVFACAACGGGPTQVQFVSNERPSSQGGAHHEHPNGTVTLPNDEQVVEPEHPLAETKQERALVHIHMPDGTVCSGAILGARFVATSQQCVKGEAK